MSHSQPGPRIIDKAKITDDQLKKMSEYMKLGIMPIQNASLPEPEIKIAIESSFYFKMLFKINLLYAMEQLDKREVGRLITMLDSDDPENWTLVEECIKQKLLEL
jgi:hypothetical protein